MGIDSDVEPGHCEWCNKKEVAGERWMMQDDSHHAYLGELCGECLEKYDKFAEYDRLHDGWSAKRQMEYENG